MKWISLTVLCLASASILSGLKVQDSDSKPLKSGIDLTGFDKTVRPQDDFHRYVNGAWISSTPIPPDRPRYGTFPILVDKSDARQREIIEELGAHSELVAGSEEQKIGDLYASLMDQETIEESGIEALRGILVQIDGIRDHTEILEFFASLQQKGVQSPIYSYVSIDSRDSSRYAVYLTQGGLGLPNRDYYLKEGKEFDLIRSQYPVYISQLFSLVGLDEGDQKSKEIYALEHRIAQVHWKPEDNRDATKTNNKIAVSGLKNISNQINWSAFLKACAVSDEKNIFVRQPSYVQALGEILKNTDPETWKDYLRFHVLDEAAPWMSTEYERAHFQFHGQLINGLQEQQPRWKRAVRKVNALIGEAVGKIYVARHFSPEAKTRMEELVKNLITAFEVSINELNWMTSETKVKAQKKRAKFTYKIGYPDRWKDYSDLHIRRDDPGGNLIRAAQWDYEIDLKKLEGSVDRTEWHMTPQTVNAYHNPRMNEIVFPAAILQPPFFDMQADDAVNYGAIGAVIGHEIGHAFDDQGRKTDGDGNLKDWWTEADAENFTKRATALVQQYSEFSPIPGLNVNGQLTLGENIGDLTGLTIAYRAYQASRRGNPAPMIDGLTGDQRFFVGWAQVWRNKSREEFTRRLLLTDTHSPPQFRTNGPLRNLTPFYRVFNIREGNGMFLPPNERVEIW